jgi:PHD/YefM family antitoxin component YafN of YafNO toxin-antitoxin module
MRVIALEKLNDELRDPFLAAVTEPVLVTDQDQPVLVIRSLLDDAAVDDLIAQHPAFQETIRRARQQAAQGRVKSLAELRRKYGVEDKP